MATTTLIRVNADTRDLIAKLAKENRTSPGELVDLAVRKLERDQFWKQYNEDYERPKADPEEWKDYQDELQAWDATLKDGLDDYPYDDVTDER
jgi:hypothetical protein